MASQRGVGVVGCESRIHLDLPALYQQSHLYGLQKSLHSILVT
jgi:hypothetical protein